MSTLTTAVRARSKDVLGGQYRAEVAAAIGSFRAGTRWTRPQLVELLGDHAIPISCVDKELRMLVRWELVERHDRRSENNELLYRKSGPSAFWEAMRSLALPELPTTTHPTMQPVDRADQTARSA